MQTIGLLGGMSWESTVTYYQIINQAVKERLGGLHSARCILYSVEFDEIERCQSSGDWARSGEILAQAAQALERAGADFILICTNTMHKVYNQVQAAVSIPILHIADLTLAALRAQGIRRVALLGTAYTMEQDFYKRRLTEGGLEVLIPGESDRREINRVIFQELCRGILSPDSRALFLRVLEDLRSAGAEGAILGCTEIGLLIGQGDTSLPLFDTTQIHAQAAAALALSNRESN